MAPDLQEVQLRRRIERILRSFDFAGTAGHLSKHGRRPRGRVLQNEVEFNERDLRSLARRLLLQVCRGDGRGSEVCESGGLLALRTALGELKLYRVDAVMCG